MSDPKVPASVEAPGTKPGLAVKPGDVVGLQRWYMVDQEKREEWQLAYVVACTEVGIITEVRVAGNARSIMAKNLNGALYALNEGRQEAAKRLAAVRLIKDNWWPTADALKEALAHVAKVMAEEAQVPQGTLPPTLPPSEAVAPEHPVHAEPPTVAPVEAAQPPTIQPQSAPPTTTEGERRDGW